MRAKVTAATDTDRLLCQGHIAITRTYEVIFRHLTRLRKPSNMSRVMPDKKHSGNSKTNQRNYFSENHIATEKVSRFNQLQCLKQVLRDLLCALVIKKAKNPKIEFL